MEIDGRPIGPDEDPYFIAEAGVNHNGDLDLAEELIDVAASAGADAVKFQTFSAERLVSEHAETADYQKEQTDFESQQEMLRQYELGRDDHVRLMEYSNGQDITFLSTPFDPEGADLLNDLDLPAIKLGSGELDNYPLLEHVAEFGKPMIVSTGMGTMEEVHAAYEVIRSVNSAADIVFLHCTSAYPCDISDVHLRAMQTMDDELPTPIGYSDHTALPETPALAVAAGACVVEKHFTLDSTLPGPDHEASLEPDELQKGIELVRSTSTMLGKSQKAPVEVELENKIDIRKSLHSAEEIPGGAKLTGENVEILRPATGISPTKYESIMGTEVKENIVSGKPLTPADLRCSVNIDE